jgi:hypothetical protein
MYIMSEPQGNPSRNNTRIAVGNDVSQLRDILTVA